MSADLPQPSPEDSSRVFWNRLFRLWAVIGLLGAVTSVVSSYQCPSLAPVDRTFRFVSVDPEKQSRYEAFDRWEARLAWLANAALVYGLIGVVVFFRRGCVVFVIAGGVVFICLAALLDAAWVAP